MLTDQLVEFWKLNGSRVGKNGIAVTCNDGLDHFAADGIIGQCWDVAQILNRTLHHQGPEITGLGPWTLSLWVRYPAAYTLPGRRVAGLRDDSNGAQKMSILLAGDEEPNQITGAIVIVAGTTLAAALDPPISFADKAWIHVLLRYTPTVGCVLTVNGQHVSLPTANVATAAVTPHLTFGGYYTTTPDTNAVDAIGWWSRALSDEEAAATFAAGAGWEPSDADPTPDAFAFAPIIDANPATLYASEIVEITGMDAGTAISIIGGEYQIDGGAWTSAAGTINPGQTLELRATSSAEFEGIVTVTITVGTVSVQWTITTAILASVISTILWGGTPDRSRVLASRIVRGVL